MKNKTLQLAWDFINYTNRNVFLTGKAGTGKTTFLHQLKLQSHKSTVVVAPTGVAAINAKGVTIHSFFQLPFGPIPPSTNSKIISKKFSKQKINIIRALQLLIIDEISMVRADVLDAIDSVLKRFRNKKLPFGGLQVLMIGDLSQLSPVVKDDEWQILKPYYNTSFFFSSHVYQNCNPITIELTHVYRQDNPIFINILNEIRNNALSENSVKTLNNYFKPNFNPKDGDGYITLTTHNNNADIINQNALAQLKSTTKTYNAEVTGDFKAHMYPNDATLKLKEGAQVMFIKNDTSADKMYYNGKIGKIIALHDTEVVVKCPNDDFEITVQPVSWENITYKTDTIKNEIIEDKIGSYTQIPLRLAWAITIHKSQGLTFEKAVIDIKNTFTHGQTYVALSRCKSLNGLVLTSKIKANQIVSDSNVEHFYAHNALHQPNYEVLQASKQKFQLDLISEIFDFFDFLFPINRILDTCYKYQNSIEGQIAEQLNEIKTTVTHLLQLKNKFDIQLQGMISSDDLPETHQNIQQRFVKAVFYFKTQTKDKILSSFKSISFSTDNKAIQSDIDKNLDRIDELLTHKLIIFKGLKTGFKVDAYLKLKTKSTFTIKQKPKTSRKTIAKGTSNSDLFELLRDLRNTISIREDVVHYQVFTQKSLYGMCELLPQTKAQLANIHGLGKTRIAKYGDEILDIIKTYCVENNVESNYESFAIKTKKPKRQKGDSQKMSLKLFKAGKSIQDIADERELNPNTIFNHLASFIETGEVKILDLMSQESYTELKKQIPTKTFENISDLKHQLDDKYTYEEIRLVLNELN